MRLHFLLLRALLMLSLVAIPIALLIVPLSFAGDEISVTAPLDTGQEKKKEKSWWEKREKRPDIYYPHKPHMEAMKQGGDPCLLCHPFSKTDITDLKQLKPLSVIANEPLEAICHDCHMDKLTAPWRCDLCHNDPAAIWPDDHNFDYLSHHGEDARLDGGKCRQCHIDVSFCTDCHFRRDSTQRQAHGLGYRASHGIDARINAANCSRCHNARYCSDCHKEIR